MFWRGWVTGHDTTKEVGDGFSQGLAISHGAIIEKQRRTIQGRKYHLQGHGLDYQFADAFIMPFQKFILSAVVTVWGLAVGAGMMWVTDYSSRPSYRASAPASLPLEIFKYRKNSLPTLLVFSHPHCPCSRATLAELARLVAQNQNRANVHVLFYQPLDKPREWVESDLWHQAARIPGVNVARISELELHRFGVATSGQSLLYDTAGKLVFSGGITRARGHEGDNTGRSAISEFLRGNQLPTSQTPVFGCSITEAE